MFGRSCWDLVYVDGWFWKVGGVYCVPVVFRVGSVDLCGCVFVGWWAVLCGSGGASLWNSMGT